MADETSGGGGLGGITDLLSKFFSKGGSAEQLFIWGVLQQLIGAMMAPAMANITQAMNHESPQGVLSPDAAVTLVVSGVEDIATGQETALYSGMHGDDFAKLVDAGLARPSLADLVALYQRGLIQWGEGNGDTGTVAEALRHQGMDPDWIPVIKSLATQIPSVAEVMNAWLEGQITEDEARTRYLAAGGDPTWFETSYNANGESPTPDMLLDMLHRGIIPQDGTGQGVVSYHQGFLEGPWRDKWEQPMLELGEYIPPPRTVTAMQRDGSLTADQALQYYKKQGMSQELAAAYVQSAESGATASDKDLAKSDVLALYSAQVITADQATPMLQALGYGPDTAAYLLSLTDLRRQIAAVNSAVSRVHSLYVARKISRTTAISTLNSLSLPAAQVTGIVETWDVEQAVNVATLTESQITQAFGYAIIDQATAMSELEAIGYVPHDAWTLLSIKAKKPLPGEPAGGPASLPANQ